MEPAVRTPPLTRRQRQILDFYQAYTRERGLSPTLEEVAQHFGVNKVTIFGHVAELERKGVLSRAGRGISRGLQLVTESNPEDSTTPPATAAGRTTVNVLGSIAAGAPIETIEQPEELELADLLPRDRDVYALRVRGDSMIDDGIHDGDIVLVERRSVASDGEMVVAVLPDEQATLKRLYRRKGGWRLQPAHPKLATPGCPRGRGPRRCHRGRPPLLSTLQPRATAQSSPRLIAFPASSRASHKRELREEPAEAGPLHGAGLRGPSPGRVTQRPRAMLTSPAAHRAYRWASSQGTKKPPRRRAPRGWENPAMTYFLAYAISSAATA